MDREPERPLDPTERRIVGVLMEKELATPQQYPLSVNALVAGCNQKNNRDPVTHYVDFEIEGALRSLFIKHWVTNVTGDGRVPKHRHRVGELLDLDAEARAVLAELMLRGPQQPGQLRTRVARMIRDLPETRGVDATLQQLHDRGFVVCVGRTPGERYDRWAHTLAPEDETPAAAEPAEAAPARPSAPVTAQTDAAPAGSVDARLDELERRVAALERRLDDA